jgi:DNA-binding NarL/FixJ family response regulator
MSRIRVVLADDHPVIRSYMRKALLRDPDIRVVGEASTGTQTVEMVSELEPDVVLLDVEMPGLSGIEVTARLHDQGVEIPILIISSHDDANLILALFQHGIAGYIVKDEAPSQIVPAVRAVTQGHSGWLSAQIAAAMPETTKKELVEQSNYIDQLFSWSSARNVSIYEVHHKVD